MEPNTNWFVRLLTVLLCFFLGGLIAYRFFVFSPRGDLGPGVLVVLVLIVALLLSESFDSLSVGRFLSLRKEVQKRESQVVELNRENAELRSQIVSVATMVTQRQSSTNIIRFFIEIRCHPSRGERGSGRKERSRNNNRFLLKPALHD